MLANSNRALRVAVAFGVLAAIFMAVQPVAVQARSSNSSSSQRENSGRQIARRVLLTKHERLLPSKRNSARLSTALATPVAAPPGAVSQIVDVSNDPSHPYSETALAVNYSGSITMVLVNAPSANFLADFRTEDGGATWQPSAIGPPSSVVPVPLISADPSASFLGNGNAAASFISVDNNFNTYGFFEVGDTLGQFSQYNQCTGFLQGCVQFGNQPDKPYMARDPNGAFDITWDDNPANAPNSQPLMLGVINGTAGGGKIWDSGGDIAGYLATMPNGTMPPTIYVAWLDYCGNTPTTVGNACSAPNGRLLIAKTSDDGQHFTRLDGSPIDLNCSIANFATCGPSKITDLTTGAGSILPNYGGTCAMGCAPRLISSFPSIAIDKSGGVHNGRIYAVWADGAQRQLGSTVPSTTRMHIWLSTFDPGVSTGWSAPLQLDGGNTNDAWQPTIAVDQNNGNVLTAWYDRRDDSNNHAYRPYYAQSADGGATWSAQIPLSPNMSDPQIECNGTGDYFQIIQTGLGRAQVAWTEDSASTPQPWVANIDETQVPASFTSPTTASSLRNVNGTSWHQIPGSARDVGIGPDSGCTISVVGTDNLPGGGGVYVWTGTQWIGPIAGGSGARITVSTGGLPRVVTKTNAIFRLLFGGSGALAWQQLAGAGTDIASGADGSLWIIGTNATGGSGGVWEFTGSGWQQPLGGAGGRIAVGPDGQPWIVNASHQIFCHSQTGWLQIPGAAHDVGIGADGVVWVIGTNPVGGGFGIYRWNGTCSPAGTFDSIPGGGVAISVGTDGLPFIVNSAGSIYERLF